MNSDVTTNSLSGDEEDFTLPRKKRVSEEMDITPMIDITFLLLIFFIVCSTMDPTKMGEIPEAENGLPVSAKNSAVIYINPGVGEEVVLSRVDGTDFSRDEDVQATEIIEYVTREMEKTLGASKQHVMLFGDANVSVGEVARVQRIIGDAFEDIESTYIAVKER